MEKNQLIHSLQEWQTSVLRLTAFQTNSFSYDDSQWWKEINGTDPEKKIQNRSGIIREEGIVEPGTFIMEIQPGRIDFVFHPSEKENQFMIDRLPALGPFDSILEIFLGPIIKWFDLKEIPLFRRIAFGAIVFQPMKDKQSGYELLSSFLPNIQIDEINSSDFLYQINRPRESKVIADLKINRLSKWSVLLRQLMSVDLVSGFQQLKEKKER